MKIVQSSKACHIAKCRYLISCGPRWMEEKNHHDTGGWQFHLYREKIELKARVKMHRLTTTGSCIPGLFSTVSASFFLFPQQLDP